MYEIIQIISKSWNLLEMLRTGTVVETTGLAAQWAIVSVPARTFGNFNGASKDTALLSAFSVPGASCALTTLERRHDGHTPNQLEV